MHISSGPKKAVNPVSLTVMDTIFASTGETHQNTYEEFEAIAGQTEAEAALGVTADIKTRLEAGLL
jgi:hypothetical protein